MSGMPVQPVVVKYPFCHWEMAWSFDIPVLLILVRLFTQVYNCLTVEYLPVYHPTPEEKADPQVYASNVRKAMHQALSRHSETRLTEHSFEDTTLLSKAQKLYKDSQSSV